MQSDVVEIAAWLTVLQCLFWAAQMLSKGIKERETTHKENLNLLLLLLVAALLIIAAVNPNNAKVKDDGKADQNSSATD